MPNISEPVSLEDVSCDKVRVLYEDYHITLPIVDKKIVIPKGFYTDGHSYGFFNVLLESFYGECMSDRYILSSLVHDYLYTDNNSLDRYQIDKIYCELRNYEVYRPVLHGLCFLGVRLCSWMYFQTLKMDGTAKDEKTGITYIKFVPNDNWVMETRDFMMIATFVIMIFFLMTVLLYRKLG